ncbi:hypothetical protein [Brevundimonas variabilis]|uniref:Uncharacterized protein n=1 Tax=Brevundimonas variabilis TaxID=74312 RepID=A0A7W9CFN8_9CAUL|nr:hypothetical protein [Brevundimonas variabilis]MBB5744709.1 hypothetical protein [Brevundimonas variabilis]
MADRHGEFSWRRFSISIARRLGIPARPAPHEDLLGADQDAWSSAPAAPVDNALSRLLGELEEYALAVYARAGLPTKPGHYARAPGDREWQFLAEQMRPSDRWVLVHEYPPEEGWRFATLRTLGLHEPADSPAVHAAQVLSECQALRDSPDARHDGTMALLERSIRLGITSAWLGLGDAGGGQALPKGQGELFPLPPG